MELLVISGLKNLKLQLLFLAVGVGPSHLEVYVNYLACWRTRLCNTLDGMKQDLNTVSVTVSFFCKISEQEHSRQILR